MIGGLTPTQRLALRQQDQAFLARPLDPGPAPYSMAAHLRELVRLFTDTAAPSPCSAAIAHLTGLFDRTVAPRSDLACRKGCSHCCLQPVSATAPEAFFVAAAIRGDPALVEAVLAFDRDMSGAPDRLRSQVYCPLLGTDGACSIYAARPIGCHGFVSANVSACIAAFVEFAPPQIPMPADYVSVLYTCRMMLMAAQRLVGLSDRSYELTSAVAAILRTEDAERRWLAGEPVLDHLPAEPAPPPQFDQGIRQMAAFVAPTLELGGPPRP